MRRKLVLVKKKYPFQCPQCQKTVRMKRKGWVIGDQLIIRKREGGESELGC